MARWPEGALQSGLGSQVKKGFQEGQVQCTESCSGNKEFASDLGRSCLGGARAEPEGGEAGYCIASHSLESSVCPLLDLGSCVPTEGVPQAAPCEPRSSREASLHLSRQLLLTTGHAGCPGWLVRVTFSGSVLMWLLPGVAVSSPPLRRSTAFDLGLSLNPDDLHLTK